MISIPFDNDLYVRVAHFLHTVVTDNVARAERTMRRKEHGDGFIKEIDAATRKAMSASFTLRCFITRSGDAGFSGMEDCADNADSLAASCRDLRSQLRLTGFSG